MVAPLEVPTPAAAGQPEERHPERTIISFCRRKSSQFDKHMDDVRRFEAGTDLTGLMSVSILPSRGKNCRLTGLGIFQPRNPEPISRRGPTRTSSPAANQNRRCRGKPLAILRSDRHRRLSKRKQPKKRPWRRRPEDGDNAIVLAGAVG